MNRVTLMGNIGQDPELRMTGNGNAVLKFSLATTSRWNDEKTGKQERTEWHRCVMWGKRAESLAKHLQKGSQVLVEGEIRYGSYEDRDGVKKYTTDIHLNNLEFCGRKSDAGGAGPSPYGGSYTKPEEKPADPLSDDDIPF